MKALSIQQPWAWLIANGHKDIENRDWPTKFRGQFLIHASKTVRWDDYCYIRSAFPDIDIPFLSEPYNKPRVNEYDMGGIIGIAEIVDCVIYSDSPWFQGKYGFVIRNARPLPFFPYKGQLGFFECDMNDQLWEISR